MQKVTLYYNNMSTVLYTLLTVSIGLCENNLGNPVPEGQTLLGFTAAWEMMDVSVVTARTLKRVQMIRIQLQLDHLRQHANGERLLRTGCPSCRPNNSVRAQTALLQANERVIFPR